MLKVEQKSYRFEGETVMWFLLQTKPNADNIACHHLKRQGFDVFQPLTIKTIKKNGKFVDKNTPLFPGYLFMGTHIDPIPWKSVNGTRGVSKVVTLDGIYRPVDTYIIKGLQNRCDEHNIIQRVNNVASGDCVKIDRGPFAEFICTVDEIHDARRVWILIDLIQQQIRTKISLSNLSKLN